MVRNVLNIIGGLIVIGTAGIYDTTPAPLWVAAVNLIVCALLLVQLVPEEGGDA